MRPGFFLHRTAQLFRSTLDRSFVGQVINRVYFDHLEKSSSICFVSATRMREEDFWNKSLLGKRLKGWKSLPNVRMRIAFENRRGLPVVYNEAIAEADAADILVFIHDDAWLLQQDSLQEIQRGLRRFDIVGIAGNQRRTPKQFAWYLRQPAEGSPVLDTPYLSGAVHYGQIFKTEIHQFGPWPAACELLDGVLMAVRAKTLKRTGLRFDERFDFHFYDLDFSRTARKNGLRVGTWPIHLLHASRGDLKDPKWQDNWVKYLGKWKQ